MKKTIKTSVYFFGLFLILLTSATVASQTKPNDLGALKSSLEKSYQKLGQSATMFTTDLYLQALAKIATSESVIADKPESEEAKLALEACESLTKAALAQMVVEENRVKIASLQKEINTLLNKIKSTNEAINSLERGRASKLKADLDAEKLKAQKLREEAEKKFAELQSSLIQVSNDARGTIISMSDILFQINKADLTANLKTSLAKIAGILLVFKTSSIIVEGHTDNQGGEEYNQILSEKRAENVMSFLAEQGVSATRLKAVGYGFSKPIADNSTKEGRQKNRRVDLIVQEKNKQ